jgi:hypothetical protein
MTEEEFITTYYFEDWLVVLASPRILQVMQRVPPREHLLRMLDLFLPYARSKSRYMSRLGYWKPDPAKREACALELRAAIERWSSKAISSEITQAARAFLREDGEDVSDEAWDTNEVESPPDKYLLWPESIPPELREQHVTKPEEPPVPDDGQARAPVEAASSGPILGMVPRPPVQQVEDTGVDAYPGEEDYADIFHFQQWLFVLACPPLLKRMRRMPTQEHLLIMLDAYLPYARSERRLKYGNKIWYPDPQKRQARALALRAAIERWSSPEISPEITQAARALLREDGNTETDEEWDAYVDEDERPPEDSLVWPEMPQFPGKKQAKG